jgi:prepilin-type N-terminal cleavage/methylation domain-containing protein
MKPHKGFTLLHILVTMIIIGLLGIIIANQLYS